MDKFKCVKKHYENKEVVAYDLMDRHGMIQTYSKDTVKLEIRNKKIEVINLQISSDGRLVDKAVSLEKTPNNKNQMDIQQILTYAYEYAYKSLLNSNNIAFEKVLNEKGQLVSKFYDEIDKVLKKAKLDTKLDAFQVAQGFEDYIREKYNCLPLKLGVKLKKGNCRQCIIYDLEEAFIDTHKYFYDEMNEEHPEIYMDEKNYEIYGVSLDPTQPKPIYLAGICNEVDKEITRIKGNVKEIPKNTPCILIIKGTDIDNKYKNAFIGASLKKSLTSDKYNKYVLVNESNNDGIAVDKNKSTISKSFNEFIYDKIGKKFYGTALGKMFLMFK